MKWVTDFFTTVNEMKRCSFARVEPTAYRLYTKTVDSVECALWLATQTLYILRYSPPSNSRVICARKLCTY